MPTFLGIFEVAVSLTRNRLSVYYVRRPPRVREEAENGEEGDQEGVWFWTWRSLHQHQGGVKYDAVIAGLDTRAIQVRAPKKLDEKQRALMQAYAELEPGKLASC